MFRHVPLLVLTALLPAQPLRAQDPAAVRRAVVLQHAKIVFATYSDCVAAAKVMQTAIREFLAAPDAARLEAARKAWTAARRPYLLSESFRFYAGPIDDPDGPEPLLNAWPLDESFIDAPGSADPGIVGSERQYPHLTPSVLKSLNQAEGEKNVACGWHAVEFLLWGQDRRADGPGDRPFTDYTTAPFAKRRGEMLAACAGLIVEQLEELASEWAPEDPKNYRANYRSTFEEGFDYSVERILTALIFLSENELAGERLQVVWDTRDQENEQSCFSDTTGLDHITDATGMQNVWRGSYTGLDGRRLEGPGLKDLCQAVKPELLSRLGSLIDGNVAKATAIPQPFDQAVLGADEAPGRTAILHLITSLEDTGAELRKLAQALGIEVPDVPPDEVAG